ncbi:SDR family NAD(P)-dependent oxidoreductase [Ruicaihuangia caeni]|uniref:SDR family oxidoreductase n=1 Tax=Ruicaihuangia caeni TaxID=3042517 RepID=A0AAW6TAR1_9MICO|nr:SDR family oxidoreductase [Klugiella sp. YN-L-19]MDI2099145.1 SDR family oxidoreductase [Klugiella sp. YN-L-19]
MSSSTATWADESARPVALVTGGSGGIGRVILQELLDADWNVALAGTDQTKITAAALDVSDEHRDRVSAHVVNVREQASCETLAAEVGERHGRLDALVNNAGVMVRKNALDTSVDDWDYVLSTNLTGAFLMSKACYPLLKESRNGSIVSISSTHAILAAHGSIAYSVSKAGISHLTRLLALEWAGVGIRVNAVGPTVVPSPMTDDVLADPAYRQRKFAAIPLGRPIEPEHVAAAVSYLISPAAGSTTGQTLIIDGGESLA